MKTVQDSEDFRSPRLTLADAARLFVRYPSPRVLLPAAAVAAAVRVAAGGWSRRDAKVAAGLVALEPFVEWMIHVHVLHQRPRTVKGRTIDSLLASKHRAHHRSPRDPELVFIPEQAIVPVVAGLAAANTLALRSPRAALTGTAASLLLLSAYEWTHFLIHSSYSPKSALYKAVRRTHQLHHYRNENYWFGIITPVSDTVLHTNPAKDETPPSKTAKTLGIGDTTGVGAVPDN
ncbi:sterol desaturase family protein [Streptacidiphilus rugosus]|uniref:sterol desaturase family protein n=1 Tax=Streptacidiphilus rugosus TaxID=405783 RepID=UPI00056559C8|nr:sterol desaturase family protein [Streptacidiphilus rugosus]